MAAKYKVCLLGTESVGKTAFLQRFMYDTFENTYSPTIGIDFLSKTLYMEDETLRFQFWDTAGQARFQSLIPSYIRDSVLAVLFYSITSRASFDGLDKFAEMVRENENDIKICILGSKSDLEESREVSREEGMQKAGSLGALYFEEISAKRGTSIQAAVRRMAHIVSGKAVAGTPLALVRGNDLLEVPGVTGRLSMTRLTVLGADTAWKLFPVGGGACTVHPASQDGVALGVLEGELQLLENRETRDPAVIWELMDPPAPSKTVPREQLIFHRGESSFLVADQHLQQTKLVREREKALKNRAGLWQLMEEGVLASEVTRLRLHDARRWLATALKCVAGAVRVLAEDLLNAFCQGVFLAKHWHDLGRGARLFTLASIGTAACTSLAGPIKELLLLAAFPRAKPEAPTESKGAAADAGARTDAEAQDRPENDEQVRSKEAPVQESPAPAAEAVKSDASKRPSGGGSPGEAKGGKDEEKREGLTLSGKSIAEFVAVEDPEEEHACTSHVLLLLSALGFWGAMGMIPVFFGKNLGCDAMVPSSAILYFILVCNACVFVEQWIALHTLQGYYLIRYLPENIRDIPRGKLKGFHSLFAVFLSMLGRYDTFSDIVFTIVLCKCDTITWFSIWGHVFPLPLPLHYMALFAVIVGVFACQALPGLVLLARRQYLPMAFKFNEFNILLALVEQELVEEGSPDDAELLAAARDETAGGAAAATSATGDALSQAKEPLLEPQGHAGGAAAANPATGDELSPANEFLLEP